jgi:hypothetical protein
MDQVSKVNDTIRAAEKQGSWADYAVYMLGDADTGDEELNVAISDLYRANETVHRIANKLALRYDLEMFEGR